jgi:hypothetical protein
MLDLTLTTLIVNALGKAGDSILKQWLGSLPKTEEERATQAIVKVYDNIRPEITPSSVRLLVLLRSGENLWPPEIARRLYPETKDSNLREAEAREMEYRCKFLCLLGLLLQIAGREYAITRLGRSFLQVAQGRHDYPEVDFHAKFIG